MQRSEMPGTARAAGRDTHGLGGYARWFESDAVFIEEAPPGPQADVRRYRFTPRLGQGWMEMRQIGQGLLIGRSAMTARQSFRHAYDWTPDAASFGMLLSGSMELSLPRRRHVAQGADVLVCAGDMGQGYSVSPPGRVSGISISLPPPMALALREEGVAFFRHGARVLAPSADGAARLRGLAQRMVALPAAGSTLHRLAQEALALELITLVAGLETSRARPRAGHPRWRAAVGAAIDILHAEWDQPHTITGLARRVGMNECYLKSMFRERTGEGVAAYLRRLRMEQARALIAQGGCTVQQAAALAGYANPSHFAQAFRRVHGVLPSRL